ncbi:MAG TPA: helix-turn-helix domain-containing protein [Gemmatimonadaceae bacterium]|nr:helix-turn-helix domain-containing protein [Gemmatimonadaceae bacterium]
MGSPIDCVAATGPSLCFSTEGLDPEDQFDAWRKQLGLRFGLAEVSRKTTGSFRATMETLSISKVSLSYIFSDPMIFERREHHVAICDHDDFTVSLLLEGRAVVEQNGRGANLGPGDLVLCDGRRPFRMHFDESFQQIVFTCDHSQLEARLPDADGRTAQRIGGQAALSSAMAGYVASVARQAANLGQAESIIAQHAIEILAFTLGGASPWDLASRSLLSRIRAYIEENLSDPALTPATIARHYRISRRHLYRLFDVDGDSVAGFIRRRRLLRCKAVLADDRHTRLGISEIAFAWGFNDATTFGRAFRAAFGMTPREYRRSATAQNANAAISLNRNNRALPDWTRRSRISDPRPAGGAGGSVSRRRS